MDTISSRESNMNFLPMAGIAVGAIALIFAIVALVKLSSVSKDAAEVRRVSAVVDAHESQLGQFGSLVQAVNDTKAYAANIAKGTNDGFAKVSDELNLIKTRLDKVEAARPAVTARPPAAAGAGTGAAATTGAAAATAAAGEYTVKSGDTGVTIARANGVSLAALQAANPDVNWNRLHVGQKIRLPRR